MTSSLNTSERVGVVEAIVIAACIGLMAGCSFGAFDCLYHVEKGTPTDVLIAALYSIVVGTVSMFAIGFVLMIGLLVLRHLPDRARWTTLLLAIASMGFVAVLILFGTGHYRDTSGLIALAVATPLCVLVCDVVARSQLLARPGGTIVASLTATLAIVIGACGLAAIRSFGFKGILKPIPPIVALVLVLVLFRGARRRPLKSGIVAFAALGLSCLGFVALGSPRPPAPVRASALPKAGDRPNVVLIVLDTTRYDMFACYGNKTGLTPEFDRLVSESVVYEDAISTAPWTLPSHASMFTGLYPVSHGCAVEYTHWLDDEFVTLAEQLRDDGYETVALSCNPWLSVCNLLQGFQQIHDLGHKYRDLALQSLASMVGAPARWIDKGGSEVADACTSALAHRRRRGAPLFLFVNLFEPHERYLPPYEDRIACLPPGIGYWEAARYGRDSSDIVLHAVGSQDKHAQQLARALYQAEVRHQDRCFGQMMAQLRQHVDLANTLLIMTADHGENLGEAGRWGHLHVVNDMLTHVPLVIRYPKAFPPGTRVRGICQLLDLMPTIDDVLGHMTQAHLPGRTLVPAHFKPREYAVAEISPLYWNFNMIEQILGRAVGVAKFSTDRRAVRTDRYEYIWSSRGDHELYDLASDPLEANNIVQKNPDVAARLDKQLVEWLKAQPPYVRHERARKRESLREDNIRHLQSLGYMN